MRVLNLLILWTGDNGHEIALWQVDMWCRATRYGVVFLYNFEHVFVCWIVWNTVLNWFHLSLWPTMFIITIQAPIVLIRIIFIISHMSHYSTWASTLWSALKRFLSCSANWSTIAQTINVWKNFGNGWAMFHFHSAFFPRLVVGIKRSVVDACQFIVLRGILLVGWVPAWTCDPHMLPCLFIAFIIWILPLTFALLLQCLCPSMCINSIFVSLIFSIFFFVTIVVATALILLIKILLKPRFALVLSRFLFHY